MIRLVIKGNAEDAQAWARVRNIPLLNVKEHSNGVETIAETGEENRGAVVMWYCEDPPCQDGFGYPVGTLLLHN